MSGSGTLPAMDVEQRAGLVRSRFDELEVDGLLVSKPVNIRWLTGFTGSNAKLLLTADDWMLVTDGRYSEQATLELAAAGVDLSLEISRQPWEAMAPLASTCGSLGFESQHLTVAQHEAVASAFAGSSLVPVGDPVDVARQPKDGGELARLRAAAAIADRAFAEIAPSLLADGGVSERVFARELDTLMLGFGADGISFETIVAAGPNSSRPHARPSDRAIELGDLVVIDFGASVDGYGSDMTRTLVCGGQPSADQQELYDAVAEAQAAGVNTVIDGVEQVEVDAACRSLLEAKGLGEAFMHGTGHGIGLEIHEQPILSAQSVGRLRADLVVTVEPGAYLPGLGGVRVEDSVVVTSTGCEPITHSPKGLVPSWQPSPPMI